MEKILEVLRAIEKKKKINILFACETGSRAWGFASPDSDYDIRFIYRHDRDWYLSLNKHEDTIGLMSDNNFDISGWDLKKTLMMLKKSNAALIERFQSPIEYFSESNFKEEFKELIKSYYSPIAIFHHHYSIATKFWENIKGKQEIKLKSCFYLLRSLLSCNWLIKNTNIAPMHLEGLVTLVDDDKKNKLRDLVKLKSEVTEKHVYVIEGWLNKWILELWDFIELNRNNLQINNTDYSLLNKFFIKTMYEDADNRRDKK